MEIEKRLRLLFFVFSFSFVFVGIRLFYLQVVRGENLRKIAEANRTALLFERASRGTILDRNGVILADSKPTFVVLFTPLELKKESFGNVVKRLSAILNVSQEELTYRLQPAIKHSSLMRLMDRVPRSIAFALAEQRPNLPGVSVVTEMQRRYPNGSLASHILGYLGQVNPEELEELRTEGYRGDWLIGKMGLEKIYDHFLRGEDGGMRIEVNASGHSLKILDRKEPISGYHIKTTLDIKIQKAAEEGLAETGKAGAVVAVDPRSGEILALASSPPFDPNLFLYTRGEQEENQVNPGDLLSGKDLPLFNRTIQGTYPPGSIFKIIDTAAALLSKKINPSEEFYCPGYFWLGNPPTGKKFLCWKNKGHGKMSLFTALIQSCNVYFYHLGLKVGPDPIEAMAREFGLGKQSGFEFPNERAGLIPGRTMFKGIIRRWYEGDTLNMAIGQGTTLFTPIQAAMMISVVANRGKLYRPQIIKEIQSPTGEVYAQSGSEILNEVSLPDEIWDFLNSALTEVVEQGTAQSCKIPGIKIAGKTGTAQNPQGKDHGWFVAYAPVGNPVIALAVLVEHGLKGSVTAAPIARKIILAALPESVEKENLSPEPSKEFIGD